MKKNFKEMSNQELDSLVDTFNIDRYTCNLLADVFNADAEEIYQKLYISQKIRKLKEL